MVPDAQVSSQSQSSSALFGPRSFPNTKQGLENIEQYMQDLRHSRWLRGAALHIASLDLPSPNLDVFLFISVLIILFEYASWSQRLFKA